MPGSINNNAKLRNNRLHRRIQNETNEIVCLTSDIRVCNSRDTRMTTLTKVRSAKLKGETRRTRDASDITIPLPSLVDQPFVPRSPTWKSRTKTIMVRT